MFKTVIYKLEGVLLDDETLRFKFYELLWFYLRRKKEFRDFESVLRLREKLAHTRTVRQPYLKIAQQFLSKSDFQRFQQEIKIFSTRYYHYFVRLIPGMKELISTTGYYYRNVLFARDAFSLKEALQRYSLRLYFRHAEAGFNVNDPETLEAIFRKILEKTKTSANEAILVSNTQVPEIAVANRMGMYSIQVQFKTENLGASLLEHRHRLYLKSLEKFPEGQPQAGLFHRFLARPRQIVRSPQELARSLQKLASEAPSAPEKIPATEPQSRRQSFWELIKEALEEEFSEKPQER